MLRLVCLPQTNTISNMYAPLYLVMAVSSRFSNLVVMTVWPDPRVTTRGQMDVRNMDMSML